MINGVFVAHAVDHFFLIVFRDEIVIRSIDNVKRKIRNEKDILLQEIILIGMNKGMCCYHFFFLLLLLTSPHAVDGQFSPSDGRDTRRRRMYMFPSLFTLSIVAVDLRFVVLSWCSFPSFVFQLRLMWLSNHKCRENENESIWVFFDLLIISLVFSHEFIQNRYVGE